MEHTETSVEVVAKSVNNRTLKLVTVLWTNRGVAILCILHFLFWRRVKSVGHGDDEAVAIDLSSIESMAEAIN